jgi:hypothetical protein
MLPGAKAVVENDAVVALCSGTGGELQGIIVIAGTGSIGMAVDGDERVRVGGMGPVLGDAGNAYSIGCAALAAVVKGADGRGPETTALTGRMMEALGISDIQEGLLGSSHTHNLILSHSLSLSSPLFSRVTPPSFKSVPIPLLLVSTPSMSCPYCPSHLPPFSQFQPRDCPQSLKAPSSFPHFIFSRYYRLGVWRGVGSSSGWMGPDRKSSTPGLGISPPR